jgi:hypothetical protein
MRALRMMEWKRAHDSFLWFGSFGSAPLEEEDSRGTNPVGTGQA